MVAEQLLNFAKFSFRTIRCIATVAVNVHIYQRGPKDKAMKTFIFPRYPVQSVLIKPTLTGTGNSS